MDVCILEVGMGGRYDATNVIPSPVACGVSMLDLDHTQVNFVGHEKYMATLSYEVAYINRSTCFIMLQLYP